MSGQVSTLLCMYVFVYFIIHRSACAPPAFPTFMDMCTLFKINVLCMCSINLFMSLCIISPLPFMHFRHYSVNACLCLLCSMDGLAVTTVEGIGNIDSLHPVQERIAKAHGSQCGYCTPGFVMSMYSLLRNNSLPTQNELERAFDGNLCRCTGYRAILDGYKTFTKVCLYGTV